METRLTASHAVATIQPHQLAGMVKCKSDKILIVDSRTFCEYNTSHILNSVNVWSSKIRKKRLQQNSISVLDYLQQACQMAVQECLKEIVVYDQSTTSSSLVPPDTFLHVLLHKLNSTFDKVHLVSGGFLEFQSKFPELCEDSTQKASPLTSLSQPCLPVTKNGPTRILPFMFLGSQYDANNKQLLMEHNITYELNVSTSCPKPDFMQDSHFMRISVNDNFSEKLLPHFSDAFRFIDKVRELGGRVLVHCLAGISRSATVAIAFVMKHLNLHYDEAYRYVKNRRPTISPNINFVGQLLELDRQLLGDGLLYRSPTAPLYLDSDIDLAGTDVLRSSSMSSCMNSTRSSFRSSAPSSPSTALASLSLFSCLNRLPISPATPPKSPEFFCSYSVVEKRSSKEATPTFSTTASIDVASPVCVLEVTQAPLTYVDVQSTEPMVVRETRVAAPEEEENNNVVSAPPPPAPKTAAPPPKNLPRCYSSSETHLNTRRLLESRGDNESQTRKSFSSDQVGRGFQPLVPPPSSSPVFSAATSSAPSDLARCDSWSTSGLGSEISDWDSLHDDVHSEDAQGPFDAVFADVYPGEWPEVPLRKNSASLSERRTKRQTRRHHRNVYFTSSLNGTSSSTSSKDVSSPTPRPVSLPGVTGAYIATLNAVDSNSNIDMGVVMDDNSDPEWQSEKEVSDSLKTRRSSSITEHSPVNTRTMGDNCLHTKEHKDALSPQQDLMSRRISRGGSMEPLSKLSMPQSNLDVSTPRKNSLEDRWKTWDSEFHKKIKNIQSNVTSWDSTADPDIKQLPSTRESMAGLHLAQELMQSMEDLLENEINDIKRQASALSTKFGLHTVSSSKDLPEKASTKDILSKPGIIDPSTRTPISFCPTLQQGIIRSGKLTNLPQQSLVQFEPDSPILFNEAKKKKLRAKSEPPDEGLYRARSCPGIAHQEEQLPEEPPFLRKSAAGAGSKEPNRYSCGALDSLLPSFESCPDISQLRRYLVDSASGTSSTHSSFNRLLQVS